MNQINPECFGPTNPTAAPCPICGPECHCVTAARGSSEGATWTDVDIDVDSQNPLAVYQSLTAEREERIRQLESTIADRDQLIVHIRERYDWMLVHLWRAMG